MLSRKNTAFALTIGLAVVGAIATSAVPASAAGGDRAGRPAIAAHHRSTGSASDLTSGAPRAQKAPTSSGNQQAHIDSTICYVYSNGTGDLCQWYYTNYSGSRGGTYSNDASLWDDRFMTGGSGQGAIMANNAESTWNYDSYYTAWVCTGTSYTGSCGYVKPNSGGNFNGTYYNNVESLYWTL